MSTIRQCGPWKPSPSKSNPLEESWDLFWLNPPESGPHGGAPILIGYIFGAGEFSANVWPLEHESPGDPTHSIVLFDLVSALRWVEEVLLSQGWTLHDPSGGRREISAWDALWEDPCPP